MATVRPQSPEHTDQGAREARAGHRRLPAAAGVAAFFLVLVFAMFAPSLVGGKVLSAGDRIFFQPPFSNDRPAGLVRPSNRDLADPVEVFHPDLWRAHESLADGSAALWHANVGAGRPLLASQQFSPLFPPFLLAFVLPFWTALGWIAALKVLTAAVGAYLLCRAFALDRGPSALGGTVFAFSVYMTVWLQHPLTNSFILLPWVFLATRAVARGGGAPAALGLGALVGVLLLAGHPETELIVLLAAAAFLLFELWDARRDRAVERGGAARRAGLWGVALVGGLLLSAVVTLPVIELFLHAHGDPRGGPGAPFGVLASWFFPEWWGRPDKALYVGGPFQLYAEKTAYIGALPTLLALGGLAARPGRVQVFFVAMAAVTFAVVMRTPVNELVRGLPGGENVALMRMLVLVTLSGAVLAAFGLQRLVDGPAQLRRRMLVVMGVAALLPLGLLLFHLGLLSEWRGAIRQLPAIREEETSYDVVRLGSMWRWALLALGGVALVALLLRARARAASCVVAAVLAVTAFDLVTLNRDFHPEVEQARADPPAPAVLREARARAGDGRVMGVGRTFFANLASRYDVLDVNAHDHPLPERFERLFTGLGGGKPERWIVDPANPRLDKMADVFSVRYLLTEDGGMQRNDGALPRAWMAYSWFAAPNADAALFRVAVTPATVSRDAPALEDAPAPRGAARPADPARIVVDDDERVEIEVDARRSGYLVLNDSFFPGWGATVDGESARILPANVNFRAVAVPAGAHRVAFEYRPASARAGAAISFVTALAMAALAAVLLPRRRRRSAADVLRGPAAEPLEP